MTEDRHAGIEARIRERAYHLWLEEGRPDGRDGEHWRRAERELTEREQGLRDAPSGTGSTSDADAGAAGTRPSRAKPGAAARPEAKPRASRSRATGASSASASGSRSGRRPIPRGPAV
ncbi:MAG: DUF2934 domain-containing protein [Alphaproteobacteria bacterium]